MKIEVCDLNINWEEDETTTTMTEPEETDRWSALAEELGLPPQSEERSVTPSISPREVSPVVETASAPPTEVEGEAPPRVRRRRVAATETVEPQVVQTAEPSAVESPEAEEAPSSEDRPRRRRRRRGSKKSAAGETVAASEADATGEPTATETEDGEEKERPRHLRRRGRKPKVEAKGRPAPEREEFEAEEGEVVEESPAKEVEDLGDEADEENVDFSNWTVPSWTEIIAGLYRPER